MEPAGARDANGSPKRLSNEIARLPVIGRIPVNGLVLDFVQGCVPANLFQTRHVLGGRGRAFERFRAAFAFTADQRDAPDPLTVSVSRLSTCDGRPLFVDGDNGSLHLARGR
jgi:hypothetical protein